jgi:hypothetical protein
MLPLRAAAATTGSARDAGSPRAPAAGAGVAGAEFQPKYQPAAMAAAVTIAARTHGQRRRRTDVSPVAPGGGAGNGTAPGDVLVVIVAFVRGP